jgi:transcription initiation factor TFIIE subunit beta
MSFLTKKILQLDITSKTRLWLKTEALNNNPKISAFVGPDGQPTYLNKPPYNMVNKKSLLKILRLPRCDKVIQQLIDEAKVLVLTRPTDKKKIVFFYDHTADFQIDPGFQKLWRSVAVDSIDEKIQEFLEKQGIRSMVDHGTRKDWLLRQGGSNKVRKRIPMDNEHMLSVLEDYSDMTTEAYKEK